MCSIVVRVIGPAVGGCRPRVTAGTWVLVAVLCLVGCRQLDDAFCTGAGCEWTAEEWARVQSLSYSQDVPGVAKGLELQPDDPSNAHWSDPAAAALGRTFYYSTKFSGAATLVDSIGRTVPYARAAPGDAINVSCATCHDPNRGGTDVTSTPNTVSIGAGWYDVNGQQTLNAAYYPLLYWNGRSDSLWSQAAVVSESAVSMNGTRLQTFWAIADNYRDEYVSVFGCADVFPSGSSPEVETLLVPATDPTTGKKNPTAGQCALVDGVCPPPCGPGQNADPGVDSGCWPRFPLKGKVGFYPGCDPFLHTYNDPSGVQLSAEPAGDAFDCMAQADQDSVTRVWVNFGKAIEAFEYTLTSGDSPFDEFVREGQSSKAISPAAKRGARLFVGKASCIDCHNTPLFSDTKFHDIGIPQAGDHVPTVADCNPQPPPINGRPKSPCNCTPLDETASCSPSGAWAGQTTLIEPPPGTTALSRRSKWSDLNTSGATFCGANVPGGNDGGATDAASSDASIALPVCATTEIGVDAGCVTSPSQILKGAWRTPSLRDVAITAPYMHDGYYQTLDDVVWHYNNGGIAGYTSPFTLPLCGDFDGGLCEPNRDEDPGIAAQIKPLDLSADEVSDLVEFLKTLTGKPLNIATPSEASVGDAGGPVDAGTQ